jgi:NAD(P)-dependent dehydrogenase (short-subunit alcohol dehydrogenase family)
MSAHASRRGGAVITGAGRGLGLEIARRLAGRGYAVHVTDLDADAAAQAAAQLGRSAFSSALDVRDERACHEIAMITAERAGSLEVWVNNAGVLMTGPAWEQPSEVRRLMLEVNALGTINGTLAALALMRPAGEGHVVAVVSLAGIVAAPGETVYGASKHAAIAFSIGTLTDLRLAGIRDVHISCLCPDGIWTPMLYDKLDDPAAAASFTGVLLQPAEVASHVGRLLDHPRPVLTVPRWRGAMLRAFDATPRLAMLSVGPVLAYGRWQQRRIKRRLARGG